MCDGMARGVLGCRGLSSYTMSNQKHIVLAGGGTAGHVNPLLAVAHVIRELEPDADIAVVGTVVGLEHDLVPQAGFELETIEKVPFPRRPNMAALKFPAQWKPKRPKSVTFSPVMRRRWLSLRRIHVRSRICGSAQDGHSDRDA